MIQSLVADAVSRALDHLYKYRDTHPVDYKILLQIHDAVLLEVPIEHIETVYDEVLPTCMTKMVEIWPTHLDGRPKENIKTPYHLGIGRDVQLHWGEDIPVEAASIFGVPKRFCVEGASSDSILDLIRVPGWKEVANQEALQSFIESKKK